MPVTPTLIPNTVTGTNWSASDAGTLVHAVSAVDSIYADGSSTDYLICSNFGFSIPSTATIQGIEIFLVCAVQGPIVGGTAPFFGIDLGPTTGGPTAVEKEIQLDAQNPIQDRFFDLGGASDLWGSSWTPAQVNGAGFSVYVRRGPSSNESPHRDRLVDKVSCAVYYSDSSGNTVIALSESMRYTPRFGRKPHDFGGKRNS